MISSVSTLRCAPPGLEGKPRLAGVDCGVPDAATSSRSTEKSSWGSASAEVLTRTSTERTRLRNRSSSAARPCSAFKSERTALQLYDSFLSCEDAATSGVRRGKRNRVPPNTLVMSQPKCRYGENWSGNCSR
eukprot:1581933-Prymnesium_polylepis.1